MHIRNRTTIPALVLLGLAVTSGCDSDRHENLPVPICDDIGYPLGISPVIPPAETDYAVSCAYGWGNAVEARPALDTIALPADPWWISLPHPVDGWILGIVPDYLPEWNPWLEAHGVDLASIPVTHVLIWIRQDGSLGWVVPDFSIWGIDVVGDELWALGWDSDGYDSQWLLIFDPASGELLDSRPWDLGPRYNLIAAASDPAGGVWITAIEDLALGRVEHSLYRATTIDTVELVATRTTKDPRQLPSGGVVALPDGAAAWWTTVGFEVVELDGSVRWTHPDGMGIASDADSMLITSRFPTGVGAAKALRVEKVAVADGSLLWIREHRRFEVMWSQYCGSDRCGLTDFAHPVLRPDGGYLLVGRDAYPSSTCIGQPLIMAVSAEGDAEWAHRVETCGYASDAAFRDDSKLEMLGITWANDGSWPAGAWTRWFQL
jgi:hypothetical protein